MKKMSSGMMWGIGIAVVVLILIFYVIGAYNSFVGLSQNIDGKWSRG